MNYYEKEKNEVIDLLKSNYNNGLDHKEVLNRLNKYGKNELPKKKKKSIIKIFFEELINPIVLLLVITVAFSFVVNEIIDAIAIIFIITIDLILGTFEQWRALKNANNLQNLIKYKVKVIRDSKETEVDSTNLVIGDIVLLESGNKISADMRLLEAYNFQVDESILTGESLNIYKFDTILDNNTPLAERKNMVYAGTTVTSGRGRAIVTDIALNTEIGKIAKSVTEMKEQKSPLTIRIDKLSKQISLMIIIIAIIIFIALYLKNIPEKEIFLLVITLSVSAMPEGLPLALTMALTITSNKMSKKNVIVKKLNYVESLGSCTVIATDKTGTLTINEQTAKKITLPNNKEYEITGIGYNFDGGIKNINEETKEIITLGVLNNESGIEKEKNNYNYYGDSIDIAFQVLGKKTNINNNYEVLERIPYESENKYSAVFYKINNNNNNIYYCTIKGSIEKVCEFCNKMTVDKKDIRINIKDLKKQNDQLAKDGYRVIAIASGLAPNFKRKNIYDQKDIPNLTFKGLVSFIDPIKKDAKKSILTANKAGIKVIMITGDHPLTALAIAKDLSLANNINEVVTGIDLNNYYENGIEKFDEFIKDKKVFARVTPLDKLHIVESLKRQGEFVAVTGDGVNDTPAIKSANIGIAMGSGTDIAKETASMIIIDDSFKSIISGIKYGRCAYNNIRKICYFLISCGLSEFLFIIMAIILNLPLPLVAIQLLWLNIVTNGLQDIGLSFEKAENSLMNEHPRNPNEAIFNKNFLKEVLLSGTSISIIVIIVWFSLIKLLQVDVNIARSYVMTLMVIIQNIHVLNCRSENDSVFESKFKNNPFIIITIIASIVLQIVVMEVPILSKFLKASTIPYLDMLILLLISSIILWIMELYKINKNKKES